METQYTVGDVSINCNIRVAACERKLGPSGGSASRFIIALSQILPKPAFSVFAFAILTEVTNTMQTALQTSMGITCRATASTLRSQQVRTSVIVGNEAAEYIAIYQQHCDQFKLLH